MAQADGVVVDDVGLWRGPQRRAGIHWDEVYAVSGSIYGGYGAGIRDAKCVELDFSWGEFFSIWDSEPGFADAIAAMTLHLPGIEPNWFDRVRAAGPSGPPVQVWKRPDGWVAPR